MNIYFARRKLIGHVTWPTNRYSHGQFLGNISNDFKDWS